MAEQEGDVVDAVDQEEERQVQDEVSERAAVPAQDEVAVPEVEGLGYEEARDELVEVVRRLESGGEPLEASLALWERGEALAARCQQWLDGARERLEAARSGAGQPAAGR